VVCHGGLLLVVRRCYLPAMGSAMMGATEEHP